MTTKKVRVESNMPVPVRKDTVALLVLCVEYDHLPDMRELEEVLDKAREVGGVERAEFFTLAPQRVDLKNHF